MPYEKKTCPFCKCEFVPKTKRQYTCGSAVCKKHRRKATTIAGGDSGYSARHTCVICGKEFQTSRRNATTCGLECGYQLRKQRHEERKGCREDGAVASFNREVRMPEWLANADNIFTAGVRV